MDARMWPLRISFSSSLFLLAPFYTTETYSIISVPFAPYFSQQFSPETHYTCLSFLPGIPLHSVVSCTRQLLIGRSGSQVCIQIISCVSLTLPTGSMRPGAINELRHAIPVGALGALSCLR